MFNTVSGINMILVRSTSTTLCLISEELGRHP